jgi:CBS domain-containing protein
VCSTQRWLRCLLDCRVNGGGPRIGIGLDLAGFGHCSAREPAIHPKFAEEDRMKVRDVMSKSVKVVSPNDTIQKAAAIMSDNNIGILPVCENERLVGMVTDRDIAVRAVARGNVPSVCKVREVMSTGVKYVFEDEWSQAVARSMARLKIRRLPVVNREERLVGIVSLGDLAMKQYGTAAAVLREVSLPTPMAA